MKQSKRFMIRAVRRNDKQERHGTAAVEFAIVAPLFFMLIFGCIEFGRALMVQQILTNASRVGARQAITLTGSETGVVTATTDYATNASVPGVSVTVTPSPSAASAGDMVTVDVSVPYSSISWTPPWFMGGMTLSASSVMRKEGFE